MLDSCHAEKNIPCAFREFCKYRNRQTNRNKQTETNTNMNMNTDCSKEDILNAVDYGSIIVNAQNETVSRGDRSENSSGGWTMSDGIQFRFADVARIEDMPGFKLIRLKL